MLNFLNLKTDAFGLDISDFSLKIIQLKKKNKFYDLSCFNEVEIKPGIVNKREIRKPDQLAEIIKKAVKQVKGEKIRTRNAIISLPEEKAFLQIVPMPRLSEQDLKTAIIFEAENHIPLAIQDVYLDYEIIPLKDKNSKQIDVLLAAFPKKIINTYLDCLDQAGIKPIALETESLALSRALIKDQFTNQPVMIMDFGSDRTNLIVFNDYSVKFVFSLPISSSGFSEVIARAMKIDLIKAEKLKTEFGLSGKIKLEIKNEKSIIKEEKGKVFEALIPALTDLIEQTKKYLDYCKTSMNGQAVEKILISGNGARLKSLIPFLASEINIPVEIGNPWVNVLSEKNQPKKQELIYGQEQFLGHATVLGLSLRGVKKT